MSIRSILAVGAVGMSLGSVVHASPILPATVMGSGIYGNSASILADGVVPVQGAPYNGSNSVFWSNPSTVFTFDLGSVSTVTSALLSADNNDTYQVAYSTNGVTYQNLFTVQASYGNVGYGMDIFSTDPASIYYWSGLSFAPVQARYLQLYASGGDGNYGSGELDAFGIQGSLGVPEPASMAILCAGMLVVGAFGRRKAC